MKSQKQKGSDGRQTEPLLILCIAVFVGAWGLLEKIAFIHAIWPCHILCHLSKKFVHDLSWWHLWMAQLSLVLSCCTTPIKVVAFLTSSDSKTLCDWWAGTHLCCTGEMLQARTVGSPTRNCGESVQLQLYFLFCWAMPLLILRITLSVGKDVTGLCNLVEGCACICKLHRICLFHNYSVLRAFPAYCTSKKCAQEIFDTFVRMYPTLLTNLSINSTAEWSFSVMPKHHTNLIRCP